MKTRVKLNLNFTRPHAITYTDKKVCTTFWTALNQTNFLKFETAMQHSINFTSIKSKLLFNNNISRASHFYLVVKDCKDPPSGFKILNFSIFCLFYIISTQSGERFRICSVFLCTLYIDFKPEFHPFCVFFCFFAPSLYQRPGDNETEQYQLTLLECHQIQTKCPQTWQVLTI